MAFGILALADQVLTVLPESKRALARQFVQFGIIGVFGFVWYTGTIYATAPFVGPYAAGVAGYVVAATMNWLANRLWTFRHVDHAPMHRQWAMFLAANALGALLNLGTSFALIAAIPLCRAHLVLPALAGTLAGMFVNFAASRALVFGR